MKKGKILIVLGGLSILIGLSISSTTNLSILGLGGMFLSCMVGIGFMVCGCEKMGK